MKTKTEIEAVISPKTEDKALDVPRLVRRFIVWCINLRSWKTSRANRDLQKAFRDDPDFARVWQSNIAMPILDGAAGKLTHEEANEIADRLMKHLFDYPA